MSIKHVCRIQRKKRSVKRIPEQHCRKCGNIRNSKAKRVALSNTKTFSGLTLSLLIAILPKCPMCAIAYSTAITMCSGKAFEHQPDWTSYISVVLAGVTMMLVLWNFRGIRTIAASAIILAGGVIIFNSELFTGNTTHYYIGCALVLGGVWTNGSLLHFVRKWTGRSDPYQQLTVEVNGTA